METQTLETSETFGRVMSALAAAQAMFPPIEKNRTAYVRSEKGNFQFDYADLATVLTAVTPALSKNGLALLQPVVNAGDQVVVQTWVVHGESGEWIRTKPLTLPGGREAKSLGIQTTYLRRYQVSALLAIAPEEDVDDGQDTGPKQRQAPPPANGAPRAAPAPRTAPPDRSLEPGVDPAAMSGGSEEVARPDGVAAVRAAIVKQDWKAALVALTALPSGPEKERVKQEYQTARHGGQKEVRP
jgi:hypothetical protein